MLKFNAIYDKNCDLVHLLDELSSLGVVVNKNFSSLGVLNISANDTNFSALPEILSYEEDIEIVPELLESWHLLRIGSQRLPMRAHYLPKNDGEGSVVYVVDSGIISDHPELQGASIINLYSYDGDFSDTIGHGTAVASLIVGKTVGVAKKSVVKVVKIPSGISINISILLQAFDAILSDHLQSPGVKVINCSWLISKSQILDLKIQEMQDNNLVVVAAAGNAGLDANLFSPVGLDSVLGVGASDAYDRVVSWDGGAISNWGPEVDITAPGIDVDVALLNGSIGTASGTSFATAIVSGIVLQNITQYSNYTAQQIQELVIQSGKEDLLFRNESIYYSTPNLIAFALVDSGFITCENPYVDVQAGTTETRTITFRSPIQTIKIDKIKSGRILYALPPWCSFDSLTNTLTISPDVDLTAGKYQILLEGVTFDDIRVDTYGILVTVFKENIEEVDKSASEYYYTVENQNVVVQLQGCNGFCFPYDACTGTLKGVGCGCGQNYCGVGET